VSPPGVRIGSFTALASVPPEGGGGDDDAPSSETRPLDGPRAHMLRVFMCTRGPDVPEKAWLTVTDDAGAALYEGWLLLEDGVEIELNVPAATLVRLSVETERWHRQARVPLVEGLTEHVFT
jgi:hypothetical protein